MMQRLFAAKLLATFLMAFCLVPTGFAAGSAEQQAANQLKLFKSGFPALALENLLKIRNVGSISPALKAEWRKAAPAIHPVWGVLNLEWTADARRVFPEIAGSKVLAYPAYIVNGKGSLRNARANFDAHQGEYDKNQQAFRQNQLGIWEAIYDKNATALALMQPGVETSYDGLDGSRVFLNRARVLYQKRQFNEALLDYAQVRKGSDYWIEAKEEMAYTYMKLNRPEQALAELQSVLNPVFANQVGPEPYFLAAFINLKICNYGEIFKILKNFKTTFKDRLPDLQKLAKTGGTKEADEAVFRLVKGPYSLQTMGGLIGHLPRNFHRDLYIRHNVDRRRAFLKEYATAFDGNGPALMETSKGNAETARINVFKRLKFLAEQEIVEFRSILNKLQIVEAEVTQRIAIADRKGGKREKTLESDIPTRAKDRMAFPASDEVWLDELDSYQVSVKDCPTLGRSKQ